MTCSSPVHTSWTYKILSTLGVILHVLLIDIARDILRWWNQKPKCVKGRVIVITGGASGLGREMGRLLAVSHRARVVLLDVNEKQLEDARTEIENQGGEAHTWVADISNWERMQTVAEEITSSVGHVDIVVCNAAVLYFGLFMEIAQEDIRRAVDVNLLGTINTIRAFLPPMENRRQGHIVCVSSIAGHAGETYGLAYCPSKFAVRGVMECLEMELRDRGIEDIICTTICPYFARTPMINDKGLRPTSTWVPFMSVKSCSRRMVDAILREKEIAFVPPFIYYITFVKCVCSYFVTRSLREYLNCRYTPSSDATAPRAAVSRQLLPPMANKFVHVPFIWWLIIPPALLVNFLAWYAPSVLSPVPFLGPFITDLSINHPNLLVGTNLFAAAAHSLEGIIALKWSSDAGNSFDATAKWFIQTFIIGFPSLRRLFVIRNKYLREKRR